MGMAEVMLQVSLLTNDEIIGYQFVSLGKMTDFIKKGDDPGSMGESKRSVRRRYQMLLDHRPRKVITLRKVKISGGLQEMALLNHMRDELTDQFCF